ncbi:hypothetical protein [Synechococcus sp. UW140]|uniref:hypothetical protein n=1 Tax=Synechococcus sp. UW140 TaxID=368503 RepID=UPI003137745F
MTTSNFDFVTTYIRDLSLFTKLVSVDKFLIANPYLHFRRYDTADHVTYNRFLKFYLASPFFSVFYSLYIYFLNIFFLLFGAFFSGFRVIYSFFILQPTLNPFHASRNSNSKIFFISHLNDPSDITSADDFYFPGLCSKLLNFNSSSEFILTNKPNYPISIQAQLSSSRGVPCRLLPQSLTPTKEFRLYMGVLFRTIFHLFLILSFSKHRVSLKSRFLQILLIGHSRASLPNLRLHDFFSTYFAKSLSVDIVFPFEGNCWESMLLLSASQNQNIRIFAFVHSLLDTDFPAFAPLACFKIFPYKFIIPHLSYINYIKKIFLEPDLNFSKSVGFSAITRSLNTSHSSNQHTSDNFLPKQPYFIISPCGFLPQTLALIAIAYEAVSRISLLCIFSIHPFVYEQCVSSLPKHPLLVFVKGPLQACIVASSLAFIFERSTACLVAAYFHVPICNYSRTSKPVYHDIIPSYSVSTVDQLCLFLVDIVPSVTTSRNRFILPFDPISLLDSL